MYRVVPGYPELCWSELGWIKVLGMSWGVPGCPEVSCGQPGCSGLSWGILWSAWMFLAEPGHPGMSRGVPGCPGGCSRRALGQDTAGARWARPGPALGASQLWSPQESKKHLAGLGVLGLGNLITEITASEEESAESEGAHLDEEGLALGSLCLGTEGLQGHSCCLREQTPPGSAGNIVVFPGQRPSVNGLTFSTLPNNPTVAPDQFCALFF